MKRVAAWMLGISLMALRLSCRPHYHGDPRGRLRASGRRFSYAALHAHQIGSLMSIERGAAALASRSADGQMIVPTLRLCGLHVVRGSGGRSGKGGAAALQQIIRLVRRGIPCAITVDGPRGPRGKAKSGIGMLAEKADADIIPVFAVARRRWILTSAWDRLQIPKPFSRIDVHFGQPISPRASESSKDLAKRIETALADFERTLDPTEAAEAAMAETQIRRPAKRAA